MKIAFVGASGYGNVGDDTYPVVFREQLAEHECVFFNSDLPAEFPADIALLALGGGGILHNAGAKPGEAESPHFRCMKFYLDHAVARGIPFGFVSCGFQFPPGVRQLEIEPLRVWSPYLKRARFITLRSPACVKIAAELSGRDDARFFPDAAYLLKPEAREQTNTVAIIPAGVINAHEPFLQHFLRLFDSMSCQQFWIPMGSARDDGKNMADAMKKYPRARFIDHPTPREALELIAGSRFVLSGRYHGMIFARSSGVPFFVPQDAPHKIVSEDFNAPPGAAIGHLETLREAAGSP